MQPLEKRHPFSFTIGEGPYKFVGTFDLAAAIRHQQNFGDTARAFADAPRLEYGMGTCSHCGHAILNIMVIRRGDGKLYGVGSDCVMKVAAAGNVGAISEMERTIRRAEKVKRRNKEADKIESLQEKFESALVILARAQHPNEHLAKQGKTYADYYRFVSKNSKNMGAAIKLADQIKDKV